MGNLWFPVDFPLSQPIDLGTCSKSEGEKNRKPGPPCRDLCSPQADWMGLLSYETKKGGWSQNVAFNANNMGIYNKGI